MAIKIQHSIHTLRLKVKTEGYPWLNEAAIEVKSSGITPTRRASRPLVHSPVLPSGSARMIWTS